VEYNRKRKIVENEMPTADIPVEIPPQKKQETSIRKDKTSKTPKTVTLEEGTVVAIRGDHSDGFFVARTMEATSITNAQKSKKQEIPIRWFVEAKEEGLQGFFCHPNWLSTVEYGAIIQTGLNMEYIPHMDMYCLHDDYGKILKKI
jgi:hypothetical protein